MAGLHSWLGPLMKLKIKEKRWEIIARKASPHGEGEWEKSLRKWDSRDEGRTETESKERDILAEGANMGLARSLALEKFPEIQKDDPS